MTSPLIVYSSQFFGSLVFYLVFLKYSNNSFYVAAGLFIGMILVQNCSIPSFNPALTVGNYINNEITGNECILYIMMQIIAIIVAILIHNSFMPNTQNISNTANTLNIANII